MIIKEMKLKKKEAIHKEHLEQQKKERVDEIQRINLELEKLHDSAADIWLAQGQLRRDDYAAKCAVIILDFILKPTPKLESIDNNFQSCHTDTLIKFLRNCRILISFTPRQIFTMLFL